ncbi:hypothetical protein, partial [Aquitalea palustris]|uniref:hypothetical protein n=1 Tax=Aquitalea palustris TaxID=2480983 RepID=UPI001F2F9EAD
MGRYNRQGMDSAPRLIRSAILHGQPTFAEPARQGALRLAQQPCPAFRLAKQKNICRSVDTKKVNLYSSPSRKTKRFRDSAPVAQLDRVFGY